MGIASRLAQAGTAQHTAERCTDDGCQRYGCVMYRRGHAKGYEDGTATGYAAGFTADCSSGFTAGQANCGHGG
jgi:hypothetical protein